MTVDEAIENYIQILSVLTSHPNMESSERTLKVEEALIRIIEKAGFSADTKMEQEDEESCKVYVRL